jgi:hypothetical protein
VYIAFGSIYIKFFKKEKGYSDRRQWWGGIGFTGAQGNFWVTKIPVILIALVLDHSGCYDKIP